MANILVPEVCPPPGESLGEQLSAWLQELSWDYFFTITLRRPRRDSVAFIRDIRQVYETFAFKRLFIACEPHRFNHNLHAHGLFLGDPVTAVTKSGGWISGTPTEQWDKLFHRFGRSRVEPVKSLSDVSHYCSKYVTKMSDGDNWNIFQHGT